MNILLIGSGGREHALAWKIRQSKLVDRLYCAPGNAGIAAQAEVVAIGATDIPALIDFSRSQRIDLCAVGPEQPLVDGIVDEFTSAGIRIFGPSREAAALEGSKVFAKRFMQSHNIPTAEFRTFGPSERFDAERYINEIPAPIVVKADGLAQGKGVVVCETKEEALDAVRVSMEEGKFGEAGKSVVIEEYLVGEEASVFAITDGTRHVLLPPAQDHKRIFDNDLGKNTGGMGAYAPAPVLGDELLATVSRTIVEPTLRGMSKEQRPYAGCLYIGLMLTETGPKVIEYNCRFGDPETQVVLPLFADDLVALMVESIDGTLRQKLTPHPLSAVCVVIASGGYPDAYEIGKEIVGLDAARQEPDIQVFHAGTKRMKDQIVTAGGRVLGVTAVGPKDDLEATVDKAYRAVGKITFDGAYYRSDIGKKGIERLRNLHRMEME